MSKYKHLILIILGAGLFSFGLHYLIIPNNLYEGGVTGITLIFYYLFRVPPAVMNIVINVPLFLIGWKILGKRILYNSLLGTVSVSVWLSIFEKIPPFAIDLQGDLIIVALLAGIIMGLGLGIIFRAGGTTGGSDILARIGHKYTSYSLGQLMLAIDSMVLVLTIVVSKDLRIVLYTLIFVTIVSKMIDMVSDGGYGSKGVMVITDKSQELAVAIDSEIERGVTFIKAQRFYSQTECDMVYSVIYKSQLQETKDLIHRIDPHAFITIIEAHEVLGEGFTFDEHKQPLEK